MTVKKAAGGMKAATKAAKIRSSDAVAYLAPRQDDSHRQRVIDEALGYIFEDMQRGDAMSDPQAAGNYFAGKLRHRDREVFAVLFLDGRHRVIDYQEMFSGTTDGTEVHPREVVRAALLCNAAAVLVAHNHPSGNREPSAADRAVTHPPRRRLRLRGRPAARGRGAPESRRQPRYVFLPVAGTGRPAVAGSSGHRRRPAGIACRPGVGVMAILIVDESDRALIEAGLTLLVVKLDGAIDKHRRRGRELSSEGQGVMTSLVRAERLRDRIADPPRTPA